MQKSHAKINLFLKTLGKENGFHQLESALAFLDLADDIEILPTQNFSLEISGEFAKKIDEKNNLFTKIYEYFVKNFAISQNFSIKLQKNIPVGAGLGGGSSNGAFFMKKINEICKLNLSKEKLQEISFNFGSDIAFFFENQAAIIQGRGHISSQIPAFQEIEILLINPKIFLSTKEVFENFGDEFSSKTQNISQKTIEEMLNLPNDLTKAACKITPEITQILQELKNNNAKIAKMSGSGATCFGIFKSAQELDEATKNFAKKFPNYFIKKSKILSNV